MIPRIEEKLEITRLDYPKAIAWVRNNGFSILHPSRVVNSIYFDNSQKEMLLHAQEGITPRRKVRVRYYGLEPFNFVKNASLETKESTALGRSKSIQTNVDIKKALIEGVFDKIYGLCAPIVKILYLREYYIFEGWRVTLDRDITYELFDNYNTGIKSIDPSFVLEIKTSVDQDKNLCEISLIFPRSKFSKYERAFENLDSYKTSQDIIALPMMTFFLIQ